LADVEHVTTEGDRTLRFALRRHAAWLPEDLSAPLAVRIDPSNPKSLKYGTGPYQVISRDDASLVLKRFTSYNGGVPGIDRVTVRSAPTLRTAWASLLRGEVDMVTDLPPDSVELVRNENIRIITFARNYFYLIAFNGRSPKFADPRIRRALNIAIDRDSIVRKILKGSGFPASGPLWPKHWAYDASVGSFAFDPHQAATLLDAAKLPIHESRDTSLPPARLRITCMIPSQFSILEQIALDVQRQLSEVGVDIHFDVQPFESYEARLKAGDFETVMVDLTSGPSLSRSSIMWRSPKRSDALRIFNYDNPVTEALFENLRTAPNDVVTRSEVRRLQQAFLESPPAIFLAWNERARAIRSEFRVDVEAGADPISTLWRWQTDKTIGSNTPMASR
jgi:peptide/nickel transport system substrate-binding protein